MSQAPDPFQRGPQPRFRAPFANTPHSSFSSWGAAPQQWQTQPQQRPRMMPPGSFPGRPGQYLSPSQYPNQQQFGPPQPPFGPPPGWRPTPQKKSAAPTTLFFLVGIAAVALLGLLAASLSDSGTSDSVTEQYQNEDYRLPSVGDPPPLPLPQTEADLEAFLVDNPLYDATVSSPVRCELGLDDVTKSLTDPQLERRMRSFVSCLTRVWGPTLEAAGFAAYQPHLTVYPAGSKVQTPCGTNESMNAFYCGADQNLYLAPDIARVLSPRLGSHRVVFELIVAHEYGHAIEGRSGIAPSAWYLMSATDEATMLEISRRLELQADCFAGLALRSLSQSMNLEDTDAAAVADISEDIGDDTLARRFGGDPDEIGNHGTGVDRRLWAGRGLANSVVSSCNTWTAPDDEVR